jgi:signal transduction histidine kinase
MAEIEAGKVRLERQAVDLEGLVRESLETYAARTEGRPVTVINEAATPRVVVDRELVGLALRQLIDNWLKYAPPQSPVAIRISAAEDRAEIRVTDKGPGIPARERERVFDRYYRRQSGRDGVPGTGMGLHIAREIFRAHGGDLTVHEAEGGGAEFRASLPVEGLK